MPAKRILVALILVFLGVLVAENFHRGNAQTTPGNSTITIHVHKSGLFSALGHNHEVTAPVAEADVDANAMTVSILVHSSDMKVLDTELSQKDRDGVQATMLGAKVLDAEKFPDIRFKSSHIEQTSPQHYRVTGLLELHGKKKDLTLDMSGGPLEYKGAMKLKQTDFGIEPVSAGGGTVKVKDELDLEFDIFAEPQGAPKHGSR